MAEDKDKKKQINLLINTSTVVGSTYSQVARVTVSDIEMTIEFAYFHPADPTKGQSVARITMPVKAGMELAYTIIQTEKMHQKRKDGRKND